MSAQPPIGHSFAVDAPRTPALPRRIAAFAAALTLAAVGVLTAATIASAAPACTRSWDGGGASNSWSDADNWDGAGNGELPIATDHVCVGPGFDVDHDFNSTTEILSLQSQGSLTLSGGSLSLTDAANGSSATAFTQSGGTLAGTGTLTVLGSFDWTGGDQIDTGHTVIADGATATIGAPFNTVTLRKGRTFDNQGTTTWVDGYITLYGAAPGLRTTIENSGTFDAQVENTVLGETYSNVGELEPPLVHNTGTFIKSTGAGTTYIAVHFDNDGTLEAASGTIRLSNGGDGTATGSFTTAASGLIEFADGTYDLGAGASIDGNVRLSAATLTLSADVAADVGTFTQSGGTLAGTGTLTVLGSFDWTGGDQIDTGHTVIADGATATIGAPFNTVTLRKGRTFDNQGTTTWVDGYITLYGAAPGLRTTIENSGTFDAQVENTVLGETYSNVGELEPPLVHNTGTFIKSTGAGTTYIAVHFDNDGTLEAASGTIRLSNGGDGTATGSFTTAASGLIEFADGTYDLGAGASIDGNVRLSAATLTLSADVAADVGTFTQSGGTLAGTGTLTVLGSFDWTGGDQIDTGHTVIADGATATIGAPFNTVTLRKGRTFDNQGTTTWVDGYITLYESVDPVTIENSGVFEITSDTSINSTCCDGPIFGAVPSLFHNSGTVSRSAGAGAVYFFMPFTNDGTVSVDAGTLAFRGVFTNYLGAPRTLSGGTWDVTATLDFAGADIDTNAATIILNGPTARIADDTGANGLRRIAANATDGALTLEGGADLLTSVPFTNNGVVSIGPDGVFASTGAYEQADGTTTLEAATSTLTATASQVLVTGGQLLGVGTASPAMVVSGGEVAPGLSPGTIRVSGTYQQVPNGSLHVELGGTTPGTDFDVLAVSGAAQVGGTLDIELIDGFVPSPGDTFRILTTSARTGQFASVLGTDLGNGRALTAQYNATDVTLVVTNQSLSINDTSATEGDTGSVNATFTVTLAEPSADTVTVDYTTGDDTAVEPDDYTFASGTLQFDPGQTSKTVTVAIAGDTLDEENETLVVDLTNEVNAPLAKSEGIGTILDDDPPSSLSIANAESVTEGNAGTIDATFTVTLAPASGRTVSVTYVTASDTATSPADFAPKTGTLIFLPGQTSKSINVSVKGDTLREPDETFFVNLSAPVKAVIGTARAIGTIVDDDEASISVNNVSVDEGDTGTTSVAFTVTLSAAASENVSVRFSTADETATAPDDYLPSAGTLTWTPGQTSKTVTIEIVGDTLPESNETFLLNLSNAVHGVITDDSGRATIADNGDVSGTPDFQLLISPSRQVLLPGGTAKYAVHGIGLFGYDKPITLSTPGLPAGITSSWSVNPLDLPGTSILTLTAAADADLGDQPFTVRGTDGEITHDLLANTTLDFGLVPICYGSVEGYVTDEETGAPIPGARISLTPDVVTDVNGFYRIDHIQLDEHNNPIEDYPVTAVKATYWDDLERGIVICDGVTQIDLQLLKWRPASLRGTVVEGTPDADHPAIIHPTSTPIEGAVLGVRLFAGTTSEALGAFDLEIPKLNPRNEPIVDAELDVTAEGYWTRPTEPDGGDQYSSPYPLGTIHPDEHRTDLIVPLVKKCTGTVSGVVTDAVTQIPIANATVDVAWPIKTLTIKTNSLGHFTYPGVLLGYNNTPLERSVSVSAPGYLGGGATFPMDKCGGAPPDVAIALTLAPPAIFGSLEGHVYDAETNELLTGVQIFTLGNCAPSPGTTCTGTDANGFYRLPNVPLPVAGQPIQVAFIAELAPTYYRGGDGFFMTANETTVHDFYLVRTKFTRLTGVVTDRFTGLPIPGAGGSVAGLVGGAITDGTGHYLTDPITLPSPGDPTALAMTFGATGYWPQTKSKAVQASTAPFELNFDLLPICEDATVVGTVVNASTQQPIVGADVRGGASATTTGPNGTYKLEHLHVGTNNTPVEVTIQVTAPGFHPLSKTVKVFCNATLTLDFGRPTDPGTIIVTKTAHPSESTQAFEFAPTWTTGFSQAGGQSKTMTGLNPGAGYRITETVPGGWRQASATCSDGSPVTNIGLSAGETVTCTFVNEQLATLIIRKTTDPDPDPSATSFGFTAAGGLTPATFSLANGGAKMFSNVVPGSSYSVIEDATAGWHLAGATCSDGSPVTKIDLAPGETVTCTFTNDKVATIVVKKTTSPDPDATATSFGFSAGGGLNPTTFNLTNSGTQTFSNVAPGSGYSVAEGATAGWRRTSAICSDGSPITNIDVSAGETITCTFANEQLATLMVKKTTDPDPDPSTTSFGFTTVGGLTPASFSLANGATHTFNNVVPGSGFGVAETPLAGWRLRSATCSDGSPVDSVDLAPGETVTCTFVNERLATLIVKKTTHPDPDPSATSFGFTAGGDLTPATFNLVNGGTETFSNLTPGAGFSVAEGDTDGWQKGSATCSDGSPVTKIDLGPGETVTCTFVNEKLATLVVKKTTEPDPDPSKTSFGFTAGGGLTPASFSLVDGGIQTFTNLAPASGYSVAEGATAGWRQASATCSDGSPVTNVDLAPGETVTCTFVNRPAFATIVITKTTEPAGSTVSFGFTRSWGGGFNLKDGVSATFGELEPGSGYSVAETAIAGWQQYSATCSDGSPITNIDLSPNETVSCTFVNRKLATVVVRKQTQPSPDPSATSFGFTAGGGLTPASFSLANSTSRTFSNVVPGSGYSVAEGQTAGWQQYSATCSDGSPIANLDLAPGETVTCTFVNRKLATLTVIKQTVPSPDQTNTSFGFTSGGGLTPASFALVNGASRTFTNIVPGAGFSLAETVPAGWQQASATCSDRSPVTNIDLAAGETVTCTFVNNRAALAAGAHTIGFWQNKNGQTIIKSGAVANGACTSGTWLRQFAPFQDLAAKSSCTQVADWVTSIIKAASSSGASMNAMLKAQMLATSLSVYFSDAALGGNKIGAPAPVGGVTIDLKTVCIVVDKSTGDGSCSGKYEDVSLAFGGASALKVIDALTFAASKSNPGGTVWYDNKKPVQALAKDLFDAINNNVAFGPP